MTKHHKGPTNGLNPIEQLSERQKCPTNPTKRKYKTLAEAEDAAATSSARAHRTIVPYACAGCGFFHLTSKSAGSDEAYADSKGAIKTTALQVRESSHIKPVIPERREIVSDEVIPANMAARRKVLVNFLEGCTEVSTDEVIQLLHCSRHSAQRLLHDLGWKASRGPGAVWRPKVTLQAVEGAGKSAGDPVDGSIARHPAGKGQVDFPPQDSWVIEAFPPNLSVHDYLLTLKTAGLAVQVRAWRP